jgi:uncharacterized protein (DUF608 family)
LFDWTIIEQNARKYTGDGLRCIAFPLGGIGTGTISLGGRGNLRDWEIFNRPAKGRNLPYTFFAIRCRRPGAPPIARVLERRLLPPYDSDFGLSTGLVSGLPRIAEAEFAGAYPIARIIFQDDALPVGVTLEAFNPLIPMNDLDSGIPAAVLCWSLRNAGPHPVEVSLCLSALNPCGLDGAEAPGNRRHPQLGRNLNTWAEGPAMRGLTMSSTKYTGGHAQAGDMAIAALADDVTHLTRWERAGWWDDVQSFWDAFTSAGRLPGGPVSEESPDGETDVGSIAVHMTIEPGGTADIPFIIAWRFPNLHNRWNNEEGVRGVPIGNWYASQWPDAWSAAQYVAHELPRLVKETQAYCDALFDSTVPAPILDAASANVSIMRTTTCLRTGDGRFNGFEGCGDSSGCCPMNCTHVWNYEQAVAFLFPELERTMRETDFLHNTRQNGDMAFRTLLPLKGQLWDYKPAADGQMGTILKVYREWLQSGDVEFLRRLWPSVSRALEFAWSPNGWDADRDGVMEGEQHNTYDIEFHGPNTMMTTLYLGALRACEEMARTLGETARADAYRAVYETGRKRAVDLLYNGSYFDQIVLEPGSNLAAGPLPVDGPAYPRYQHGAGCLSDQMLGQWFARVVGLGDILPPDTVRTTLRAIYDANFRRDLSGHHSVQRVYAVNDESGLLLCTWPRGGRPAYPFPYADEVWTGIEYQVAAHMIYEGLVDDGVEVAAAVRSRHDGAKRNPWNEFECGHHYARAMASWSLLLAFSGYRYNAAEGALGFDPATGGGEFRCFFTAGSAWGTVALGASGGATVRVLWGEVTLRRLALPRLAGRDVSAALDGRPVAVAVENDELVFGDTVRLTAGVALTVAY